MKKAGVFIDFLLAYEENGRFISSQMQAQTIIDKAKALLANGAAGVAITYSANFGQTQKIAETYQIGAWNTETGGSNQADVMMAMENLLGSTATELQGKLRIAPITTMTYTDYGGKTHAKVITDDLAAIKALLEQGWVILGWINQVSAPDYAVGGGIANSLDAQGMPRFPKSLSDFVQMTLKGFSSNYPAQSAL